MANRKAAEAESQSAATLKDEEIVRMTEYFKIIFKVFRYSVLETILFCFSIALKNDFILVRIAIKPVYCGL